MGLYKGIATKAKNNGYYDSDKWICEDHFKDKYAKQFIQENGEMHACDFCDNGASSKICIPINMLLDKILTYINSKFTLVDGNKIYMLNKQVYSTDIIFNMEISSQESFEMDKVVEDKINKESHKIIYQSFNNFCNTYKDRAENCENYLFPLLDLNDYCGFSDQISDSL